MASPAEGLFLPDNALSPPNNLERGASRSPPTGAAISALIRQQLGSVCSSCGVLQIGRQTTTDHDSCGFVSLRGVSDNVTSQCTQTRLRSHGSDGVCDTLVSLRCVLSPRWRRSLSVIGGDCDGECQIWALAVRPYISLQDTLLPLVSISLPLCLSPCVSVCVCVFTAVWIYGCDCSPELQACWRDRDGKGHLFLSLNQSRRLWDTHSS